MHADQPQAFAHLDTAASLASIPSPPLLAAAYLGARPIADALAQGADVVITGRVADASLFLAPLAYEHGWAWDDWDRLAAGILVGHLLECSGQSLGGNYSGDWWALPHPWDLPYPMARVDADGTAVITKPASSGGRVSTDTLRHQLLYEVHDPALPVARCRRRLHLGALRRSRRRRGAHHRRARHTGHRHVQAVARVPRRLGGRGARRVLVARRVREGQGDRGDPRQARGDGRARRREWHFEYWGVDALGGPTVPPDDGPLHEPPECVLRVAWRCDDQRTAGMVGRELVPLTLSAPPAGMTGAGGGGRGATELLGIWPTLIDKRLVDDQVRVTIEEVR